MLEWNRFKLPGEANPAAKVTDAQVKEIRRSQAPHKVIAHKYGITEAHVSQLKAHKQRDNRAEEVQYATFRMREAGYNDDEVTAMRKTLYLFYDLWDDAAAEKAEALVRLLKGERP